MSATWRNRLAQRRLDLGLEGKEYDYIKTYIESYCKESDTRAEKLCDSDMHRTVDQVMNSMADPEFDRFTSGVVADVSTKLGRDDIALLVQRKQKEKDKKAKTEKEDPLEPENASETPNAITDEEQSQSENPKEEPIPA